MTLFEVSQFTEILYKINLAISQSLYVEDHLEGSNDKTTGFRSLVFRIRHTE